MAKSVQTLFAKYVLTARKRLGISQMKLAEKVDMSPGYMNDVERARRWVGAGTLSRLAGALHVRPYQSFLEDGDPATEIHVMLTQIVEELRRTLESELPLSPRNLQ
jgi:transcriptional regulator with XRE-family HTH domain